MSHRRSLRPPEPSRLHHPIANQWRMQFEKPFRKSRQHAYRPRYPAAEMASEPTVLSTTTAPAATSLRELLVRNGVGHRWIDLDVDPLARVFDFHRHLDGKHLPVVLFPDGSLIEAPEHYLDFAPDTEEKSQL